MQPDDRKHHPSTINKRTAGNANRKPQELKCFYPKSFGRLLRPKSQKGEKGEEEVAGAESKAGAESFFAEMRAGNGTSEAELMTLFEAGKNASRRGGVDEVGEEYMSFGCRYLFWSRVSLFTFCRISDRHPHARKQYFLARSRASAPTPGVRSVPRCCILSAASVVALFSACMRCNVAARG